jgi:nucleotide-binding universal stress UspA family protein
VLHRILVPLDGSELAERALIYATAMARPTAAKIVLLRAAMSHTLVGVDGQERRVGAIHEAEDYLARVRADLVESVTNVETVVPYGHPAECIADHARLQSTDLIVMSTHGRTGPARLLFGSVAEAVVARTTVPVFLERAWHPLVREPRVGQGSSVALLLDGSPMAEVAIDVAAQLALHFGTQLAIVRIAVGEEGSAPAHAYLEGIRAETGERYPVVPVVTDAPAGANALDEIDRFLKQTQPALVVMATHGRTGLRRAVMGSVAGHVLRHDTVPLVLVRPAVAEASTQPYTAATIGA